MGAKPIMDIDQFIARNEYVTDYAAGLMDQWLRDKARAERFGKHTHYGEQIRAIWRTSTRNWPNGLRNRSDDRLRCSRGALRTRCTARRRFCSITAASLRPAA